MRFTSSQTACQLFYSSEPLNVCYNGSMKKKSAGDMESQQPTWTRREVLIAGAALLGVAGCGTNTPPASGHAPQELPARTASVPSPTPTPVTLEIGRASCRER